MLFMKKCSFSCSVSPITVSPGPDMSVACLAAVNVAARPDPEPVEGPGAVGAATGDGAGPIRQVFTVSLTQTAFYPNLKVCVEPTLL